MSDVAFPFLQEFLENKRGTLYVLSDSHVRLRDPLAIIFLSNFFARQGVDVDLVAVLAKHRRSFDATDLTRALLEDPDRCKEARKLFEKKRAFMGDIEQHKPHASRDHRLPHPSYGFDTCIVSDEPGCYPDAYQAWVKQRAPEKVEPINHPLPPGSEYWQNLMGRPSFSTICLIASTLWSGKLWLLTTK